MSELRSALLPATIGAVVGVACAILILMTGEPVADGGARVSEDAMSNRIRDLEGDNMELQQRLSALEDRPVMVERRAADGPTRGEFDALAAKIESQEGASEVGFESPTQFGLQAAIGEMLEQREEAARQERERVVREKMDAGITKQVERWTRELGLTSYQAEQMTDLMTTRQVGQQEIRRAIGAGEMAKADAGEPWQALQADFRTGLSETLTPMQLQSYQESTAGNGKE